MTDRELAQLASESLSRVTCSFCGGRLHTEHKPDCPVVADRERRDRELAELLAWRAARLSGEAGNG